MSCDFRIIDFNYVFQDAVTLTASSQDPSFPISNLKSYSPSKAFRTSTATGTQWITLDVKTIEEIDSVVVIFNSIEGSKLSTGAVLTIEASQTNLWTSPPFSQVLTVDENTDSASFFSPVDLSYRYWRLTISDPLNYFGYIEIPKLIIGRKIQFNRVPEIGFELQINDQSKEQSTPYGHKYFDVYPNKRILNFNYNVFDADDLYLMWDSFNRVGTVAPIVMSLDSSELLFEKDRFVIYGVYNGNMKVKHLVRKYFSLPMSVEEIF